MEREFRREQHYAVSQKGVLSHIKEAHYNSEEYYCPHCGCRMLKRCGNIRAWHFAHDWRYVKTGTTMTTLTSTTTRNNCLARPSSEGLFLFMH